MPQSLQKRHWILAICLKMVLLGTIGVICIGWLLTSHDSPINKASAIKSTEEWARLAPLPPNKTDLAIQASGSAFTRQFDVSFRDTPKNIRTWLSACSGPSSVSPIIDRAGWSIYSYDGGGGAVTGEVRVSPSLDAVQITATWN